MSGDSIDVALLAHTLKSGHSVSLDGHHSNLPHTVPPKSRMIEKTRSIPKIPGDTSFESVQEGLNRRHLHKTVLDLNPKVFRR